MQQPEVISSHLPTANLETISFETLRSGNKAEATKLFDACCKTGVFYLDMSGTTPDILQAVENIYGLEDNVFHLQEEELMQYDIDKISPRKLNGSAGLIHFQTATWLSSTE